MPALRNHHYVPQFYFRRFSRNRKSVAMLSRSSGTVVSQAAIKGQASKTGYYGDEEVESALAEMEGAAAAALRRLDDALSPLSMSEEDIDLILIHLSLQRSRTVAARQYGKVLALNRLQVHSASHCVYFGEPRFSGYVQAAWEAERKRMTQHAGSVVKAPSRAIETGEDMGEILHGFQPQLPCPLDLSFLKHEVRGDVTLHSRGAANIRSRSASRFRLSIRRSICTDSPAP